MEGKALAPIDIVEEEIISWRRLLNRRDREIADLRRMLGVALLGKATAPKARPLAHRERL